MGCKLCYLMALQLLDVCLCWLGRPGDPQVGWQSHVAAVGLCPCMNVECDVVFMEQSPPHNTLRPIWLGFVAPVSYPLLLV